MEKLVELSCAGFAEALASKAPVPGGGGAAALTGALGTALCAMVGNFTVGKQKYAAVETDVRSKLERAESIRLRLLELADEDALAFEPLSKAYSIPMDDPAREKVLEAAALNACSAPIEMVELCCRSIDLLAEMLEKGSTMLISDVGCGALLCAAALESAAMNVFINTGGLRDRTRAREMEAGVDAMVTQYGPKAKQIAETVRLRLWKGE